jgi:radical SAM protein with 4Fe4S-binding SPASM domain
MRPTRIIEPNNITAATQIDPRKIFTVLNEDWLLQSKSIEVPFSIEVHPTDICNFECHYCSYATRRSDSRFASWDLETGIRFAEFICKEPIRTLYLSGGGEPLTWKYMPEVLKRLIGIPRLKKILITNGTLIGKRIALDLLQDFSLLLVSIASTEVEVYQHTMRGAAFKSKTLEHVLNLPSLFPKPGPDVNACVVVSRTNYQHLDQVAIDLIHRGFDFVYFKAEYKYEPSGENLSEKLRKKVQDQIQKVRCQLSSVITEKTNLLTFLQELDEKVPKNIRQRTKCINLQYMLNVIINAKGDIYACVPRIGNPIYSLGNIRTSQSMQPLKRLFDAQQKLQKIHEEYCAGQCGPCRFKKYNDLIMEAEQAGTFTFQNGLYKHPCFI